MCSGRLLNSNKNIQQIYHFVSYFSIYFLTPLLPQVINFPGVCEDCEDSHVLNTRKNMMQAVKVELGHLENGR